MKRESTARGLAEAALECGVRTVLFCGSSPEFFSKDVYNQASRLAHAFKN
jgi:hypothetical protein